MPRKSAGLLMYRTRDSRLEVLLVHPGGPFFVNKDAGVWTIPKGEIRASEDELSTAKREFEEETGLRPEGPFAPLGSVTQKSGKVVQAWAFEGDCDAAQLRSNTFRIEWPVGSGRWREFPEVDRAAFFDPPEARRRINPAQAALIEELERLRREQS